MTLENMARGSGDFGAMAATAEGLAKIDDQKAQIYIKNLKDRDFQAPLLFMIEGRPHASTRLAICCSIVFPAAHQTIAGVTVATRQARRQTEERATG